VPKAIREVVERGGVGVANGDGFYQYTPAEAERWERVLRENVWRVRAMQEELLPPPSASSTTTQEARP
jgi:3-hydroxybutyryl-CoA dehydrogenase